MRASHLVLAFLLGIMVRFVLASQSPRRRQLLDLAGYPFEVTAVQVDETSIDHPDPAENTLLTARLKAQALAGIRHSAQNDPAIVIAADTTVALEDQLMGKPVDAFEARRMLVALRDRQHWVHTGLVLLDLTTGRELSGVHSAAVTMRPYSDQEIEDYVSTGDPLDKAGAYGIQHPQFRPVSDLQGCYLGVMGLSVCHLLQMLDDLGVPLLADGIALEQAHQHFPCPLLARLDSSG